MITTHTPNLWQDPKAGQHINAPCSETIDPSTEKLHPLGVRTMEKCLSKHSLLKLVGDHTGERVTCLRGVVWITQSGEQEDILLSTGEAITIIQTGSILIEALAESRLKITSNSTKKPRRLKKQGLFHVSLPGYKE